ncbi:MAG: hypothetical protein ABIR70_01110 [Bryobacteraceae bacterium]
MRKTVVSGALALAACVTLLFAQGPPPGAAKGKEKAPEPCERVCLEAFVTQYLEALVAHNPFGLPLASRVKFTENDQVLDLGDGLWNVTTGIGKYKSMVSDPQSQQVGFLGTVLANDRPTTLALRLKLENRKISEIETLVNVSNPPVPTAGAAALDALALDPLWLQAETQRSTREQLIAAANTYFDALESSNPGLAQFDPQCRRVENGVGKADDCANEIRSRMLSNFQVVYPRRIPVVDEERQLVFGFFMHQQSGDVLQVESPGRPAYKFPEASSQPAFVEAAQVFKLTGGRIRRIESITSVLPYGTPNPFFGDDWRRAKK